MNFRGGLATSVWKSTTSQICRGLEQDSFKHYCEEQARKCGQRTTPNKDLDHWEEGATAKANPDGYPSPEEIQVRVQRVLKKNRNLPPNRTQRISADWLVHFLGDIFWIFFTEKLHWTIFRLGREPPEKGCRYTSFWNSRKIVDFFL